MSLRSAWNRLFARSEPKRVIVREYGRDSLVVWANLLLAPLFAALGLRVGLRSEEQLAARIQADTTEMRNKGYSVTSSQRFSLPLIGAPRQSASWYRVTYELASAQKP